MPPLLRFLPLASISVTLVSASALGAPASSDEIAIPSVRVRFAAPTGWHSNEASVAVESRKKVRASDPEMNRYLLDRARIPKLVFTKHSPEYPSVNPTLQVYETSGRSSLEAVEATMKQVSGLDGYKLIDPPRKYDVPGRDAAFARATFSLSKGNETILIEARALIISDGGRTVVFGFSGPAEGAERSETEFQQFLKTVAALDPK